MTVAVKAKLFVFEVSRSTTEVVDTVQVIHGSARDAAFEAIRRVRQVHCINSCVALFATQKTQTFRSPTVGDKVTLS